MKQSGTRYYAYGLICAAHGVCGKHGLGKVIKAVRVRKCVVVQKQNTKEIGAIKVLSQVGQTKIVGMGKPMILPSNTMKRVEII
jgi:hypothetical protein